MAWLWRKKDTDTGPKPPPDADETQPSSASDDDVIRQERPSTGDWMTLPPMATNVPIPTTFRVQTLPEILTTHQSPRLSGSLGHAVSAQAPSGTVSGLALQSGAVRAGAGADLPLRTPHPASSEDDGAGLERPLPLERALPTVQPESLAVSKLPEPAVSRSLGGPLPLVSPVNGAKDLPVARTVDSPSPPPPPGPAPAPAAQEPSATPSVPELPDAPLASPYLQAGGFDRSALEERPHQGDPELLSPPPADLAPPIQPRTLQRRLAGARPVEVPPQLRLPSTELNPPQATAAPIDLPLVNPASPGNATGGPAQPSEPTLQRTEDPPDSGGREATGDPQGVAAQVYEDAEQPAPDASAISAQRIQDPEQPGPEAGDISAQRTEQSEHGGDTSPLTGEQAPISAQQAPISAQQDAAAAHSSDDIAAPSSSPDPLPLHSPTRPSDAVEGITSAQSAGEHSVIPVQRDEGTAQPAGDPAPLATEQDPISAQRTPDTTARSGESRRSDASASPLPLHVVSRSPDAGVGSRAEQAAPGSSGISAPRSGDADPTGISAQRSEATETDAETAPTIAPLSTTTSAEQLTIAGSTTHEQIGPPAASLPLAPPDWQETLQAPSSDRTVATEPGPSAPTLQLRPEAGVARTSGARTTFEMLPLTATRSLGAQKPLSSLAPLVPSTTSAVQRSAAAAAAPALPLHTPAAAIPSAAEIAISAGLAERGPNGTLHYTHPPAGAPTVQREFVIQREGGGGVSETTAPSMTTPPVTPEIPGGDQIVSVSPVPGADDKTLQERATALAEQARKLYPHIRNQLESDIRHQLEARNRASGSR